MDIRSIRANLASETPVVPSPVRSESRVSPRINLTTSRPGILSRFVTRFKAPVVWVRKHQRHPCCVVGVLGILDRNVMLDGLITEISVGGALFRPASDFIFDRNGATIALRFAEREWRGHIVNVRKRGYGILFDNEVSEEEIEDILARFGLDMSAIAN
jgi:hypothetical protein